jgi:glutamate/aspartate transport system permease protein
MAVLAVGMTEWQSYVHVLLPVGFRRIVLPLTSEFLSIVKNSSLALTIGALELTAQARRIESEAFQGFEAFAAATVLYLAIAALVLALMKKLERRARISGMIVRSGS